jgi:6,7-dimethyl-8-ribityllumazine synthase
MSLNSPTERIFDQTTELKVAIIAARYNTEIVDSLLDNTVQALKSAGLENIKIERVPGSAELPMAAALIQKNCSPDAVIVLGVVIAGDTEHHNVIASTTANALTQVSINSDTPIINGILVTNTKQEAQDRSSKVINRGEEFAHAAIEMAQLKQKWTQKKA